MTQTCLRRERRQTPLLRPRTTPGILLGLGLCVSVPENWVSIIGLRRG